MEKETLHQALAAVVAGKSTVALERQVSTQAKQKDYGNALSAFSSCSSRTPARPGSDSLARLSDGPWRGARSGVTVNQTRARW